MNNKLAVFFPGIGYTVDKPLMHYSRRIAARQGYDILLMTYTGFPSGIRGDEALMRRAYEIALAQTQEMLAGVDLSKYSDILFVGKSIGTVVAAKVASQSPAADRIRFVLYTPLESTFAFPLGEAVAFTGTADPWVGGKDSRIEALCRERNIPCTVIPDVNHSLEGDSIKKDLKNMKMIMRETKRFVKKTPRKEKM